MSIYYTHLPSRRIFEISGEDRAAFLQGLITNDIKKVDGGQMVFAAMLTPQGKFFADFFIHPAENAYLLEIDESLAEPFIKKLRMYKLRADVTITPRDNEKLFALWGDTPPPLDLHPDPRFAPMGFRIIRESLNHDTLTESTPEQYEAHRLSHGVPDGAADATERSLILDLGYEPLNAVDYQKGCYVGQEVTARMHYKEVKRKGIMKVNALSETLLPEKGTAITAGDVEIGEMSSSLGSTGLAMVKFDALEKALSNSTPLQTKTGEVTITPPAWRS